MRSMKKYFVKQIMEMEQYPKVKSRKNRSLFCVLCFILFCCICLILYPIAYHHTHEIIVHGVLIGIMLIGISLLLFSKNNILVSAVMLFSVVILFGISFLTETDSSIGMDAYWLWVMLFPFLSNYYAGMIYGTMIALSGEMLSVLLMWTPLGSNLVYYGANMRTYYPVVYLCAMGIAALIQYELCRYQIRQKAEDEENRRRQQERIAALKEQIAVYEENSRNLTKCQHDMRHHNRILHEFIQEQDLKGADSYLHQIEKQLEQTTATSYCDNHVINGILTIYAARASRNQIQLRMQANVPDTIAIQETEITPLLANVLENAMEALQKVEEGKRTMRLSIVYEKEHLGIQVMNQCAVQTVFSPDGLPKSTREQAGGIGTVSVRDIAEAHDGYAIFKQEDEQFITKIRINC